MYMKTSHYSNFAVLISISVIVMLFNCTSVNTRTRTHVYSIKGEVQEMPTATTKKKVRPDKPYTLIVEALLDFDTSQLENKEGIEVLNTLILKDILYVHIRVQPHTAVEWIKKLDKVRDVTNDPIRTIH